MSDEVIESTYKDTNYFCDKCNKTRHLKVLRTKHENLQEQSMNGLVIYSDIHSCKDGIFEVNNLNIDKNYHIRTFELLKLPEYRKKKMMIPMPGSTKTDEDIELIRIMELDDANVVHVEFDDHFLQTKIRIGRFKPDDHIPSDVLFSELGGITLKIFDIGMTIDENVLEWYQYLINTLEILPPTKLGMLIETLKYFVDNKDKKPSDFDKSFVKTILASHEIFFKIEDITNVMNLYEKYSNSFDEADFDLIDNFLSLLQDNPEMPIQFFTGKSSRDLVYQIYMFLILEKENIIRIDRPGIVEIS